MLKLEARRNRAGHPTSISEKFRPGRPEQEKWNVFFISLQGKKEKGGRPDITKKAIDLILYH